MTKKERAAAVTELLKTVYPEAVCALHYTHDYELLFATRLSAQCTDARVNIVTEKLFKQFPTLQSFADASEEEIAEAIKTCGLFRTKARDLKACAMMLIANYGGRVPDTMEELLKLPGVGRKTANVIRGNIYNEPSIVVDTHVKRISRKLGLTKSEDPVKIEQDLMKALPRDHWILWNIHIITLGRSICIARRPKCGECFLREFCPGREDEG